MIAAIAMLAWAARRRAYRAAVVVPVSIAIAALGSYWFLERVA